MSISRQNLSIVIVTFKSEAVIHKCIKSIDKKIKIIVVENSNNLKFKQELENKYENVMCTLSSKNLGMGGGNNLGLKLVNTEFALILNPDVILNESAINELIAASQKISSFTVLAPISSNINYPNYKLDKNEILKNDLKKPFKVKSVDGFAMLFNKTRLDKIIKNENHNISQNYFDENFFMYLENDDLCKRIRDQKENIFIVPNSKVVHLGGGAVDVKYEREIELSRNWHWIWSKFYFNKKHYGYLKAFITGLPKFISSLVKSAFFLVFQNKIKYLKYSKRAAGFYNAAKGNSSWYRPRIDF